MDVKCIVLLIVCCLFFASEARNLKEGRIVGGSDVEDISFSPYHVSIQNTFDEHVCGGSIIAPDWILTAAHCSWPVEYLRVATGSVNWRQPEALYGVAEFKVHCLHDQPMYANDIALIRLNTSIIFNEHTKPVTLATENMLEGGAKLLLTGWGGTRAWGNPTDKLQKITLDYLPSQLCKQKVRNSNWVSQGHICTLTKVGEGSCIGDSGGPLVDENGIQYGIVNWGEPCGIGYPDVHASVAYYRDWIESTMAGVNTC